MAAPFSREVTAAFADGGAGTPLLGGGGLAGGADGGEWQVDEGEEEGPRRASLRVQRIALGWGGGIDAVMRAGARARLGQRVCLARLLGRGRATSRPP